MYYHEYEPDTMAPFLRGLIRRFLNRTGTPDQTLDSSLRHQPSIAAEGSQESSTHPSSQYSTHDHGSSARSLSPKNAQPGPDPADAAAKLQAEAFEGL